MHEAPRPRFAKPFSSQPHHATHPAAGDTHVRPYPRLSRLVETPLGPRTSHRRDTDHGRTVPPCVAGGVRWFSTAGVGRRWREGLGGGPRSSTEAAGDHRCPDTQGPPGDPASLIADRAVIRVAKGSAPSWRFSGGAHGALPSAFSSYRGTPQAPTVLDHGVLLYGRELTRSCERVRRMLGLARGSHRFVEGRRRVSLGHLPPAEFHGGDEADSEGGRPRLLDGAAVSRDAAAGDARECCFESSRRSK